MRHEFIKALQTYQSAFGIDLGSDAAERLAGYYEFVLENNDILHLVAPCSAEEFAIRHILESLCLLEYIPPNAAFGDVGAGAGLPSIPCLLVRADIKASLIESKIRKAEFLERTLLRFELSGRAKVFNTQFSEVRPDGLSFITCRALDKFTAKLPGLLRWAGRREMLLFGGNSLREGLVSSKVAFTEKLLPMSEQRFLFHVGKRKA